MCVCFLLSFELSLREILFKTILFTINTSSYEFLTMLVLLTFVWRYAFGRYVEIQAENEFRSLYFLYWCTINSLNWIKKNNAVTTKKLHLFHSIFGFLLLFFAFIHLIKGTRNDGLISPFENKILGLIMIDAFASLGCNHILFCSEN